MAIKQLSVFVENKQGSLHDITDALAKANINLRSMCIADTSNYGIVRIIADNPDKAKELLDKDGHAANVRLVNAFAVPDQSNNPQRSYAGESAGCWCSSCLCTFPRLAG